MVDLLFGKKERRFGQRSSITCQRVIKMPPSLFAKHVNEPCDDLIVGDTWFDDSVDLVTQFRPLHPQRALR